MGCPKNFPFGEEKNRIITPKNFNVEPFCRMKVEKGDCVLGRVELKKKIGTQIKRKHNKRMFTRILKIGQSK